MLLTEKDARINERSTAVMSVGDLCKLRAPLDSCEAIKVFEYGRRPKRGFRRYGFVQLFLLYMLMEIRKATFKGAISNVTDGELTEMGFPLRGDGHPYRPSVGTLNAFANLTLPGICDDIGNELSEAILASESGWLFTVDSTPMEASRYNRDAHYSPHYEIRMDKMHILMCNGKILTGISSDANECDSKFIPELVSRLDRLRPGIRPDTVAILDGGYDAFDTYARFYIATGTVMRCNMRENAARSDRGEWRNLQHVYSKLRNRDGFDPEKKNDTDFVLRFLYRHGRTDLVGRFLRNKSMEADETEGIAKGRWVCESVHRAMKRWIRFDVRDLVHATRRVRAKCRLLVAQFLCTLFRDYTDDRIPGRE